MYILFVIFISLQYVVSHNQQPFQIDFLREDPATSNTIFAGHDGVFELIDKKKINRKIVARFNVNANRDMVYYLYTRGSAPQIIKYLSPVSLKTSNFVAAKQTVFIVHGLKGNVDSEMNKLLVEAFLQQGDVNVVVVDWSKLAQENYITAKTGVPGVGKGLGRFIKWLKLKELVTYNRLHLVGFSLGAHIVGNAGKELKGEVARISGLDPAAPFWNEDKNCLSSKDAKYVEVIHTNTNLLGYPNPCGDTDFYVNGGGKQEYCGTSDFCSHTTAYEYMARSITENTFFGPNCGTFANLLARVCNGAGGYLGNANLYKTEIRALSENCKDRLVIRTLNKPDIRSTRFILFDHWIKEYECGYWMKEYEFE